MPLPKCFPKFLSRPSGCPSCAAAPLQHLAVWSRAAPKEQLMPIPRSLSASAGHSPAVGLTLSTNGAICFHLKPDARFPTWPEILRWGDPESCVSMTQPIFKNACIVRVGLLWAWCSGQLVKRCHAAAWGSWCWGLVWQDGLDSLWVASKLPFEFCR